MSMGNQTTVTTGAIAGALATIIWWYLREFHQIDAPAEVVAASVAIFTGLLQLVVPSKSGKADVDRLSVTLQSIAEKQGDKTDA